MAGVIKGVFLTIVLVAVFFLPLDGVDALKCYRRIVSVEMEKCAGPNISTCTGPSCTKGTANNGLVYRGCSEEKTSDGCHDFVIFGGDNGRLDDLATTGTFGGPGCACNKNLYNSVGYLDGASLFVFALILFTLVSNVGCQYFN